ncbi:type 4a pilus biogenesis protein PilO [Hydrogenimonas urashimensis]|uniref:type 4a pilus biogenesis protein PilO n=1 Tax=Hydrogenimonas urashimensis TaxID=2740515 RepID=UPI0019164398|nr:type 4a pilus biogenesis protein PilO [Hydrogenimonas urashimensis]
MKIIEDLLEKLDRYFEEKKESEFYLMVLGIMAVVGLISYSYLIPITEKQLKKDLKQQKRLEKKIREEKSYLASVTVNNDQRYKIKKLQKEIQTLQVKFNDLKEINEYSDYQIQTLSELLFNEKNWAKFLDSIALKAKKNNIDIFLISNKFINNKDSFGHVLEIGVECAGNYRNMINFLNEIEESELVVDIYNLELESDKTINANFKVSVWGINY